MPFNTPTPQAPKEEAGEVTAESAANVAGLVRVPRVPQSSTEPHTGTQRHHDPRVCTDTRSGPLSTSWAVFSHDNRVVAPLTLIAFFAAQLVRETHVWIYTSRDDRSYMNQIIQPVEQI